MYTVLYNRAYSLKSISISLHLLKCRYMVEQMIHSQPHSFAYEDHDATNGTINTSRFSRFSREQGPGMISRANRRKFRSALVDLTCENIPKEHFHLTGFRFLALIAALTLGQTIMAMVRSFITSRLVPILSPSCSHGRINGINDMWTAKYVRRKRV